MSLTALRVAAIVWNLALIALIGSAKFSTANVGAFLWGPTMDIWSAAIAISDIEFGLKGKLGYREVAQKIADYVTTTKDAVNVVDEGTMRLVGQPDLVTRAIQAAAITKREELKPARTEDGGYITTVFDDVGYADFFQLAFRIFGYSAFSTHYLYMSILAVSFLIFAFVYRSANAALAVVTLAISALFLVTGSSIFSPSTPSYACHRFLGTLALIPFLHLLVASIETRPIRIVDCLAVAVQTLLLSFVISARSSAAWCIFAFFAVSVVILALRNRSALRNVFRFMQDLWRRNVLTIEIRKSSGSFRLACAMGIVAVALSIIAVIQTSRLDRIYFSDAVMPQHFRWHSMFLGLNLHPDWEQRKPYSEHPYGDGIAFILWQKHAEERGLALTSRLSGGFYPGRIYEDFIRKEYLRFAANNPRYMLELFVYYKPKLLGRLLAELVTSIRLPSLLLALPGLVIAVALWFPPCPNLRLPELTVAIIMLWLFAMLPSIVAYPTPYAMSDQLWATLFLGSAAISGAVAVVLRRLVGGRMRSSVGRVDKLDPVAS